ncbi:MAG: metal ABC transporter substrate-binding protein, partial [bacterium]|nr:metal ABC transporter substrate-binding protein [bacterium]
EGDEEEGEHDHEEEDGHAGHAHAHTGGDPHFWLDPLRVAKAAHLIAHELTELDPSIDWEARADAYASELEALDEEIEAILAPVHAEDRKLITNHDALGYFAARYGFEIIDTVIPGGATLADPSSAELAALVERIREEGVKAIFAETIESTALAEALAAEAGSDVAVVELYTGSLGEPGSGADSLVGMLRINAERIAEILG